MKSTIRNHYRNKIKLMEIGSIFIVSTVPIGMMLFLHIALGIPYCELTRDPVALVGAPLYTGFLSELGIFLWSATSAICLVLARILAEQQIKVKTLRFLGISGILTLVLGLDDAFQIHEDIIPRIGIRQEFVFFCYVVFVLFYCIWFLKFILQTEFIYLGVSFLFFGISIFLDVSHLPGIDPYLYEDAFKFFGIVSWSVYFYRIGVSLMIRNENGDINLNN